MTPTIAVISPLGSKSRLPMQVSRARFARLAMAGGVDIGKKLVQPVKLERKAIEAYLHFRGIKADILDDLYTGIVHYYPQKNNVVEVSSMYPVNFFRDDENPRMGQILWTIHDASSAISAAFVYENISARHWRVADDPGEDEVIILLDSQLDL